MTYGASLTLFFFIMVFIILVSPVGKALDTHVKRTSLNTHYSQLDSLACQALADTGGDRAKGARKLRRKTLLPTATINTVLLLHH